MLYEGLARSRIIHHSKFKKNCGQEWIRTTEVERQRIYSPPHLAALEPARFEVQITRYEVRTVFVQLFPTGSILLHLEKNSIGAIHCDTYKNYSNDKHFVLPTS